jgi:hypothetical protein
MPEKTGPKGEEALAFVTAAIERWLNEIVAPARMAIIAALPRASPEERAAVLMRALEFLPGPEMAGQAELKPKASAAAAAPMAQGMEPPRPDAGNDDVVLSRALEALEWRQSKNGKGQWILVMTPSGEPAEPFISSPLREFLERVRTAPAETGLVLGGYRYRIHEDRFLHRWPLHR